MQIRSANPPWVLDRQQKQLRRKREWWQSRPPLSNLPGFELEIWTYKEDVRKSFLVWRRVYHMTLMKSWRLTPNWFPTSFDTLLFRTFIRAKSLFMIFTSLSLTLRWQPQIEECQQQKKEPLSSRQNFLELSNDSLEHRWQSKNAILLQVFSMIRNNCNELTKSLLIFSKTTWK